MVDYEEQLDRALSDTPDIQGVSDRFSVPDPELRQEGSTTVYENFQATVGTLDREERHVLKYLQNELGTSAHVDESGRARLTGEFDRNRIGRAVETYADRYVLCPECGLPDTQLVREQGALVLRCDACGALSSTSG
jgi:translation initiation factor 2 subunit 2